mgnify:CR=1 FL=1
MVDDAEEGEIALAPLDGLIGSLGELNEAVERSRLGAALENATAYANACVACPSAIKDYTLLVETAVEKRDALRAEFLEKLSKIADMGKTLAGNPTVQELEELNQTTLGYLQRDVQTLVAFAEHEALPYGETLVARVESAWVDSVQATFGGQGALGGVLAGISGTEEIGKALVNVADRSKALANKSRSAEERVALRAALLEEVDALGVSLKGAGVDSKIADFLVSVAARPMRLSDVSVETLTWIREHNALDKFEISTATAT